MNRGSLGESDSSNSQESRLIRRTRNNYDDNPSTSSTARRTNVPAPTRAVGAARRKNKTRMQTKALKEIVRLQKTTNLLIPKLAFARVVREISMEHNLEITRYSLLALEALQEATEKYITQVFQDAYLLTMHRKCVTLSRLDIHLLRSLQIIQ